MRTDTGAANGVMKDAGLRDTPSHCVESERAVLGAILLEPKTLDLLTDLEPKHFYLPGHPQIYGLMLDMHEAGKPIDRSTVGLELHDEGLQEKFLALRNAIPSAANAAYFARIVRNHAMLRAVRDEVSKVYAALTKPREILEAIAAAERRIFEVTRPVLETRAVPMNVVMQELFADCGAPAADVIPTGWSQLDGMIGGGMRKGDLVLVAARPAVGKSTVALNVLRHNVDGRARDPAHAILFSLEMPRKEIGRNLACMVGQVNSNTARARRETPAEGDRIFQSMAVIGQWPLWIEDAASLTPSKLRATARRLKAQHDVRLVVVDYLQLVSPGGKNRSRSRQEDVAEVARALKALAVELDVPVFAMAQLNRNSEERVGGRPKLADLRESGELEQAASVVLILHREEVGLTPEQVDAKGLRGKAELIVAKNRWGPTGTVHLNFQAQSGIFSEPDVFTPRSHADAGRNGTHAKARADVDG